MISLTESQDLRIMSSLAKNTWTPSAIRTLGGDNPRRCNYNLASNSSVSLRTVKMHPMNITKRLSILFAWMIFHLPVAMADEETNNPEISATDQAEEDSDLVAGHSYHGEVFNEGPRQSAVLIPNLGSIQFPTSTEHEDAQLFVEQGILQLHGFWYLEAERSFRQASKIDPDLAIAYWGMAMANHNNAKRARGFIDEAMKRLDKGADEREKLYVKALNQLIPSEKKDADKDQSKEKNENEEKKKRAEQYLAAMEKVLDEYPEDIEAKAFVAVQMWMADGYGLKITSRYAVDALLSEVFAANPAHPAHHYRIHLWDRNRPENALQAAALCGPASPGIAHMWHMPGHIYSKLKRYQDAAWQQEASARVDHSHMIRTRLMPDEIHNFAHNNEWLIRNLIFVGRVNEAIDQAKNLTSLPQHPRYNSLEKRGSQKFGRQRLLQVLTEYELWETLLKETRGPYLNETGNEEIDRDRYAWIGVANYMVGDRTAGDDVLNSFQNDQDALQMQIDSHEQAEKENKTTEEKNTEGDSSKRQEKDKQDQGKKTDQPATDIEGLKKKQQLLEPLIARMQCALAVLEQNLDDFKEFEKQAKLEATLKARWLATAGDRSEAIKLVKKQTEGDTSQVRPLATLTQLLWENDEKEQALENFHRLREVAAYADLTTPLLSNLKPVAEMAKTDDDWRLPQAPKSDLGERPNLSELGPFQWQPYSAPDWEVRNAENQIVTNASTQGQPTIVIFYLGFGCLHCVEQLHTFSPMLHQFAEAGIKIIAISTETLEELQHGINQFEKPVLIPLMSDANQTAFKDFRCWDDFEDQPLHGTFLIDGSGRVRWQDISYEPFNDPEFLLKEAKRLLALP